MIILHYIMPCDNGRRKVGRRVAHAGQGLAELGQGLGE